MSIAGSESSEATSVSRSKRLFQVLRHGKHRNEDTPLSSGASSINAPSESLREERHEQKLAEQRAFQHDLLVRRRYSEEIARRVETEEQRARYGQLSMYHDEPEGWMHFDELLALNEAVQRGDAKGAEAQGKQVCLRARIHVIRHMSSHFAFVVLREHGLTVQAVLCEEGTGVTAHMMHWVQRLPTETVVLVRGQLQQPHEVITGCDVSHLEVRLTHMHVVAGVENNLPFTVYAAERSSNNRLEEHSDLEDTLGDHASAYGDSDHEQHSLKSSTQAQAPIITQRTRLKNRLIDLRTPTMQATFHIQSTIGREFRQYLQERKFTEIHTPKLQGGASESGASVFQVGYFGRSAFLAQSPQLYKQMCIAADMGRVFEIGPVFRAENSNTPRHMTEYTGLDLEMEVNHYYDALAMIDGMLKHIFSVLRTECAESVRTVQRHFPSSDLQWLEHTLVLPFSEGVRMLRESGYREEDGSEPSEFEDLATRGEIRLGQLVKEKYHTDYYVLDKFPRSARPFYTMPDPKDDRRTNSFDIFVRGQEICTGGQRIHDPHVLEENIRRLGMDPTSLEEYLEGFRLGAPPHAGCGIGLERLVMLYLNLDDIRLASLFHRDPKSFPVRHTTVLRHPEASTNPPPWRQPSAQRLLKADPLEKELQPLTQLIANYGDSTNTSWLDERMQVWRDDETGAAVGYCRMKRHMLVMGNPLCDSSQYEGVVARFIAYLRAEMHAKPVWMMVSESVESILGGRFGWCSLTCTADQRIENVRNNPAKHDHEIQRKMRHTKKLGVTVEEVPFHENVSSALQEEVDAAIQDWHKNRRGTQVHLTDVRPWMDQEHRYYFVARNSDKKVCALVVLAQLAPANGVQVKWAMSFPNAPNGTIEMTIMHALDTLGSSPVTFGTAAATRVEAVHGLSSLAFKMLSHVYNGVAEKTRLQNKTEFREKLGTIRDPTYICYPKGGMSMMAVREIIDFFRE
ncbi:aspartate--tRNA ligase [Malassezia caprae]|uniref:Probable aspartate--tRNA ligase, cytoplasmic n=1 Tax=Malassezia caprae TaxID=1381934 RepID=A0AAF0IWW0_9BASI|nr:aspartate--tRNA ligase [Malassezia caprae]